MPLTHDEILKKHDKAYERGQVTRERAADDLVFYWVTNWDDNLLGSTQLEYRGEFNIIRKAGRQIMSDLNTNPIQVDFDPVDNTDDSAADILDGMYRSDMRNNTSQEAKSNALQEAVVCGVGAWELMNDYKTSRSGDTEQVIKRVPLYEANNNVFWDPNAKLMDKSDAKYVSCLIAYSPEGYKEMAHELTGEDVDDVPPSFANPEISYSFPWLGSSTDLVYVSRFFYREKIKVTNSIFMSQESGDTQEFDSDADDFGDREDEMINGGYDFMAQKTVERFIVTLYVVSGDGILEERVIPGEHIPVIPDYGERAFVEGEEHYEGITRLAKDPQRLRNFQLSYLADIVSRSPRNKPIFYPEQIQGFEDMYEVNGSDNNYPYLLQNMTDANGNPLPVGAVGEMPEQKVPDALMLSMQESRQAVDDVASAGLPQDIIDPDASGKAVIAQQSRLDMQSYIYQQNHKTAMRRDGEVYASMMRDVFDTEREVILTSIDGTRKQTKLNESKIDPMTLEETVENDTTSMSFEVYADIGPSFQSVKAQTREELKELINGLPPGDPTRDILLMEYLTMIDGIAFKDIREYSRKKLIMMGIKEPETDEEKQMLQQAQEQQAQQAQQPDAAMVMAQAEMMKGQADIQEQENKQQEIQINAEKARQGQDKLSIDYINAQADVEKKRSETLRNMAQTKQISQQTVTEQMKGISMLRGSATPA